MFCPGELLTDNYIAREEWGAMALTFIFISWGLKQTRRRKFILHYNYSVLANTIYDAKANVMFIANLKAKCT